MYVDKLDGRVSDEFFDQKSTEWRQEQAAVRQNLEQQEQANQSYLQEGVAILELANRAAELFEKQSAGEKCRLLDFVLSNSTWGNGELTVEFRQPFDLIALGTAELKQKKAAGVGSDDLHQLKYTPEVYLPNQVSRENDDLPTNNDPYDDHQPPTIIDRFCDANLNIIVKSWQHLDYESQMRIMQIVTHQQTVQTTLSDSK